MKGQSEQDEHLRCVSDFCGNHRHPGAWADLFRRPDGTEYLQLGGGWIFYGENTPEIIEQGDPRFQPFLRACEDTSDFVYAEKHWTDAGTASKEKIPTRHED